MKNVILLAAGIVALACLFVSDFGSSVFSQNRSKGSYVVRIYNLDGVAVVYVNDIEVERVADKDNATVDINLHLLPGPNRLRLVVENNEGGYSYGFEVVKDGNTVVSSFECGVAITQGCSSSKQTGIVFDKTITIDITPPILSNANWQGLPGNYAYNAVANAANTVRTDAYSNLWMNSAVNSWANSVANVAANRVRTPPWRGGVPPLTVKQINEADPRQKISIAVRYPQIAAGSSGHWFNAASKDLVQTEISSFKNVLDTPLADEPTRVLNINYRTSLADSRLISVGFNLSSETGGDPPAVYTLVLNYDLQAQEPLELASLFRPDAKYLEALSAYCMKSLSGKVSDPELLRKGTLATDFNYSSWLITRSGLEITFDRYQVASYAEGPKTVVVPYSILKPLLRPRGPISHLVK